MASRRRLGCLTSIFLAASCLAGLAAATETEADVKAKPEVTAAPTVVDVWGPGLDSAWWRPIVATVVTSNDEWTSYCAFCQTDIDIPCILIDGSLTFGLGPSTYFLSTSVSSSQIWTLQCGLDGTTAATCIQSELSGQEAETTTYSGTEIEWGALTIGEKPNSLSSLEITTEPITDSSGHTIDLTDTRVTTTPTASINASPTSGGETTVGLGRSDVGVLFVTVLCACLAHALF